MKKNKWKSFAQLRNFLLYLGNEKASHTKPILTSAHPTSNNNTNTPIRDERSCNGLFKGKLEPLQH